MTSLTNDQCKKSEKLIQMFYRRLKPIVVIFQPPNSKNYVEAAP